jgi:DNA ligase-3
MADSTDMVVIGANFGSGSKGGLMSTFLMGVYDPKTNKWKTVCKVGNGHDDETLKELQNFFKPKMVKVDRDFTKVPDWLDISRTVVPDFIVKDPKKSAVWEVVGSEFTNSKKHTAAGITLSPIYNSHVFTHPVHAFLPPVHAFHLHTFHLHTFSSSRLVHF